MSKNVHLSGIPTYRYFRGDITGITCITSLSVYPYFYLYRIFLVLLSAFQLVSPPKHTHNTLITQHTHLHLYSCRASCPNTPVGTYLYFHIRLFMLNR